MDRRRVRSTVLRRGRTVANTVGLRRRKVFAVGFNKCGTSSLHALFVSLGRPSYHGIDWQSDARLLRRFDCFSDGIPPPVGALDARFPGARFVLQVRDAGPWVLSRLAHIRRNREADRWVGRWDWDETPAAVAAWLRQRNDHHLDVLGHFESRPDDLLVVNYVRDPGAATAVAGFLGHDAPVEHVRRNSNPVRRPDPEHVATLEEAAAALGVPSDELANDIYCPSLLDRTDPRRRFADDTSRAADPVGHRPA